MHKNKITKKKTIILIIVNTLMLAAIVLYKKLDCGLVGSTHAGMVNWMA